MKKIIRKPIIAITFMAAMLMGLTLVGLHAIKVFSNANIQTYVVENMQQLKAALGETAEKKIVFAQSFEITETLTLSGTTTLTSNANITLSRNESFLSNMFEVQEDANITFVGTEDYVLTLDGNNVSCDGILFKNSNNASLTLGNGIDIVNFDSKVSGTVCFNNGSLVIDGANIYNNKMSAEADKYGVIHSYTDSSFEIKSGNIYNNTSTQTGVLFINNQCEFKLTGGKIYNNQTEANGGAFYIKSATAKFNGGEIYGNSATAGGAVQLNDSAKAEINGTKFYQNTASTYGAGLYLTGNAELTLNSGEIKNNTSAKSGAGLFVTNSAKFIMNNGTVSNNQNQSGNGGAFVNKSKAYINGGEIKSNTAVGKGGAIYNDTGLLFIKNATLSANTAGTFGGAVCNEEGTVEILSGTFTSNSAKDGGAVCGYSSSETLISGGTFSNNTASNRGDDVYGAASSTSSFSQITLNGGEFNKVNIQYCLLKLGGSVKVDNNITFNAGKKANYARIEIVSELENKITISSHSSVVAEDINTSVKFLKYVATDNYSNIFRTARNIAFANNLYAVVENNTILVQEGENRINISATECVVNAPIAASENETVSFSVFPEYQISNVKVTAQDSTDVNLNFENGTYSFVMPAQNVSISYEHSFSPLTLQVDESIQDLISVNNTYSFKENVQITVLDNNNKKLTKLFVNLNGKNTALEIVENKANFKMFNGAILTGETKNFFNLTFSESEYISNIQVNAEKQNKGLEGETITFTVISNTSGAASRYALSSVYYMQDETKVEIIKNNSNQYEFVMPSNDVNVQFEFVDLFEAIAGEKIGVTTEAELKQALTNSNKIVIVYNDIVLTQTIVVSEGEHTIVSLGDNKIMRAETLKTNMFEVGYKSTLNLSVNNSIVGKLSISGNALAQNVVGSGIYVYNSGVLNINSNASINSHKLNNENFIFAEMGKGNDSAGGSAIYNYNGIVNMNDGEICNNSSTFNGTAVYNSGRFNLYGGRIHSNQGEIGGTIYNLRIFNQEGGVIENNTINSYGGAVYSANTHHAYAYVRGGEIKNNSALKSGGAFYVGEKGVLWCKGGVISNNTAINNGGAINAKGTLFVTGTTFENNIAGSKGGAIYGYLKPVFIRGGEFTGNSAVNGGAVAVNDGVELEISAGTFLNNTASTRGGAVYLAGNKELETVTTLTLTGGTFENNVAPEGSALCVQYAVAKIGGEVNINGIIETVANPTENYGYIEIVAPLTNIITFTPNKYADNYATEEFNVIRLSENVLAQDVIEKIIISNTEYSVQEIDNQIIIYKLV